MTTQKTKRTAKTSKAKKTPRTPRSVSVIAKTNPFRKETKRFLKWKCVKHGATVSSIAATMKAKKLSSPRSFLYNCEKMGHIKIT